MTPSAPPPRATLAPTPQRFSLTWHLAGSEGARLYVLDTPTAGPVGPRKKVE